MSRTIAISSLLIGGGLLFGAAGLFASSSSSQAATGIFQCDGTRTDVMSCCEQSVKPVWWKQSGASCGAAVRCFRVKSSAPPTALLASGSGSQVVCKIVRLDRENHTKRDGGNKRGGNPSRGTDSQGGKSF